MKSSREYTLTPVLEWRKRFTSVQSHSIGKICTKMFPYALDHVITANTTKKNEQKTKDYSNHTESQGSARRCRQWISSQSSLPLREELAQYLLSLRKLSKRGLLIQRTRVLHSPMLLSCCLNTYSLNTECRKASYSIEIGYSFRVISKELHRCLT